MITEAPGGRVWIWKCIMNARMGCVVRSNAAEDSSSFVEKRGNCQAISGDNKIRREGEGGHKLNADPSRLLHCFTLLREAGRVPNPYLRGDCIIKGDLPSFPLTWKTR